MVSDLEAAENELVEVRTFSARNSVIDKKREAFLASEIAYLKAVQSGDVQLYSYDRGQSRIVEMIGTPGQDTRRVVTYVPGTFTSLKSFYDGIGTGSGVQQIPNYLVKNAPGMVAFVYKDGIFPGEDTRTGGRGALGLAQANDPKRGLESGEQSARFQKDMQSDPLLRGAEQVGIGHSWGYQNLTSSEIYGAEYEKSVSLSGAGMHEKWVPDAETLYANFVYEDDALLKAQGTGLVWDGKVPSAQEGFVNHYYARSEGEGGSTDSHSLIANDSLDNREALDDVLQEVMK